MSEEDEPVAGAPTDLQFFDIGGALEEHARKPGRVDMATSDKCYVALFHQTRRGGGEPHTHSHPGPGTGLRRDRGPKGSRNAGGPGRDGQLTQL